MPAAVAQADSSPQAIFKSERSHEPVASREMGPRPTCLCNRDHPASLWHEQYVQHGHVWVWVPRREGREREERERLRPFSFLGFWQSLRGPDGRLEATIPDRLCHALYLGLRHSSLVPLGGVLPEGAASAL